MSALDECTEAVAIAQREVYVAEALWNEHKNKARMAEEEVNSSRTRLYEARADLEKAAITKHEAIHGKPVSFDDRMEFEKRWDTRLDDAKAKRAAAEANYQEEVKSREEVLTEIKKGIIPAHEVRRALYNPNSRNHPDHPDHIHEDCCK